MTTSTAHRYLRWPGIRASLVGVGIAFLVAAAVAVGAFIGRSTKESAQAVQGLASPEAVAMIDGSLAAFNRGDFEAFGAYFASDAVFEDPAGGGTVKGRETIADLNEGYYNLGARYYRTGAVIQRGNLAAYAVSCPTCPGRWGGIDLIRFDRNYEATYLWTGNTAGPAPSR